MSTEEFQITVQSFRKDKATSGVFVRPSDSIAEVKQKIKAELLFNPSRLLLNDQPLQNTLLVSETSLSPGSLVRAAKGKQNLKKRRSAQGPGSSERRRSRKREAQEQLENLLAGMSSEERQALGKILTQDHEAAEDMASTEAEAAQDKASTEAEAAQDKASTEAEAAQEITADPQVLSTIVYSSHLLFKLQ